MVQVSGNGLGVRLELIPEREEWLWKSPTALAAVMEGLRQSAQGEGRFLGSFSVYADSDDED